MPMEPTNLPHHHTGSNTVMPNWIHGSNPPAANEQLPKSVWRNGVVRKLADYIQQLRESDRQSDEHHVSHQSDLRHKCPRHAERTCNCTNDACADDDSGECGRDRSAHKQYNGRSAGQREQGGRTNGCEHCGSKYECVCLGSGKECGIHAQAGAEAAKTTNTD